jgi:hypothetical protein
LGVPKDSLPEHVEQYFAVMVMMTPPQTIHFVGIPLEGMLELNRPPWRMVLSKSIGAERSKQRDKGQERFSKGTAKRLLS